MAKNHKKPETRKEVVLSVMDAINKNRVTMHSKLYFVAGSALLGIGSATIFFLSSFLLNIVLFSLRTHNPFPYLSFGPAGIPPFLISFPLATLMTAFVCIVVALYIIRRYDFSYKHSFPMIVISLIAAIVTFGVLMDMSGINTFLSHQRPINPIYRLRHSQYHVVAGTVFSIHPHLITIEEIGGEEIDVDISSAHKLGRRPIESGDHMHAVGQWTNDIFTAVYYTNQSMQRHQKSSVRQ